MSGILCALFGHKALVTTVDVGGGNVWRSFTCQRCGAKRQDMTHRWGTSPPTPWSSSK